MFQTSMKGNASIGRAGPNSQGVFIDLFAGCGGLSLGLMQAGWRGLFAIEKDAFAFETLRCNLIDGIGGVGYDWPAWLPKAPCRIGAFIKKFSRHIASLRGQVDLVAGGPPCQGFSLAGSRNKSDSRNQMFRHYVEIVRLLQPAFLLLENVRGIDVEFEKKRRSMERQSRLGRPPKAFSERIRRSLEDLGYHVYPGLIRAVEFGVPQFRPRYIMFGISDALLNEKVDRDPFEILNAKRSQFLASKGLSSARPVSVKEAISDLETTGSDLVECPDSPGYMQVQYRSPQTTYQRLMHCSMNGTSPNSLRLAKHKDETRNRFLEIIQTCRPGIQLSEAERERFGLKKHRIVALEPAKPSHTLTTLPDDILHYSEPRILTVREYARLQSFPDWFEFKGKYATGGDRRKRECPRYTQVANAVPPFLSELLGGVFHELGAELLSCP